MSPALSPCRAQLGPKLLPNWLNLPCWTQVGPKLELSEGHVGSAKFGNYDSPTHFLALHPGEHAPGVGKTFRSGNWLQAWACPMCNGSDMRYYHHTLSEQPKQLSSFLWDSPTLEQLPIGHLSAPSWEKCSSDLGGPQKMPKPVSQDSK